MNKRKNQELKIRRCLSLSIYDYLPNGSQELEKLFDNATDENINKVYELLKTKNFECQEWSEEQHYINILKVLEND